MNKNGQILVLDDDPDICTMIKMMLQYNNYEAIDTESEAKARKILASADIDLIIMDMLLSGSDGTDVCRRLKSDPATANIPILMFSAHPNAKQVCLAAGANDFISKPFEMNEILVRISSLVKKEAKIK